jgi:anti-sigma-K factor RskA
LLLTALAVRADIETLARTEAAVAAAANGWLIDLQDLPIREIESVWLPVIDALMHRRSLRLHFASGERWQSKPWHRWRLWRRAER